ncbi:hypothetical protein SAY86_022549 [Trapa natans]|uniref:HP domain-containing protein n=1 Tax=Trapa natans TaxID=22666 RepID=A0AAN7LUJ0_TRANT|nr:hypothetical protein SAY86_022549 [Trapa natans]
MAVSMRDLDPAFHGAGQKAGIEIWRIENFCPVPVPKSSHGKFFTGDSYVFLMTTALKNGAFQHHIHYWLGKDTSQDEAGTAAIKTVELDAALGGRAVQYREVQGHETEKFLSYFKPCIIPIEGGGAASGFKHPEPEEYKIRMFVCRGKHAVHVKEVPFARSSLNHDDIFILDTNSKIFQFNGSNSSIQERAKALEVVQYIKDTYHDGKCGVAAIEDGKLMSDAETGEFWGFFGGFAPLPRKAAGEDKTDASYSTKLLCVEKGKTETVLTEALTRELLSTNKCYLLDCGLEVFVWMGRTTSLDERKSASAAAEELVSTPDRPQSHIIRVIEGFETVAFRSKFASWPQTVDVTVSEDGRGKVAALLKRQGVDVKGLMKTSPLKEEPQPYIDCTGNLQVWCVNEQEKILLPSSNQSKFYSGDCYIFQYSYSGEDNNEEYLIGTWFGKKSIEEDRNSAISQANKMIESLKFLATQARIYEGKEPVQLFIIFQNFITLKGGLSNGYKSYIADNEIPDETYSEDGTALFRIQGTAPDNMQAIQVETAASSLNSSYCYILHSVSTVFTWCGNLATSKDQELLERQLDIIKPNAQCKTQREGAESDYFWEVLGGKSEYPSHKIVRDSEGDPHLFFCTFSRGNLKVTEIYNFTQDDLMTEDIFILDCHSEIYVWVGQQVDTKLRAHALTIGEKFLEQDFLLERLSSDAPVYVIAEGSEPTFFTRFFAWDSAKSAMHGNSFQRKLTIVKHDGIPIVDKTKRRIPASHGGRSIMPEKSSQRSRSVSFSPERVRVRGRSPAFNALAANFENPNAKNLSTPSPVARKIYPKSVTPDSEKSDSKYSAIAALSTAYDKQLPIREIISRSITASPKTLEVPKSMTDSYSKENSMNKPMESMTIQDDVKEGEAEDGKGATLYPYERLKTTTTDPVTDIDVTKRETYLSSAEFKAKFGMTKEAFYKLPKWRQNKLKMALLLF